MDYEQIKKHLATIESKEQFEINLSDNIATISVNDYTFDVNGLAYTIDGSITRNILSYTDATYDDDAQLVLAKEGRFDGTLVMLDKDGEEVYYDDLNLIFK